ncbi:MAG: DNA primase [Firmicutes bacterium]|nr:DNA primase [Bacillota bacterium]
MDKEQSQRLLQEIKDKNEIVSVISEYVTLKKTGRSWTGLCPFHPEKTPSFTVTPDKQLFFCFGCSTGGDVISFIMKLENRDFLDAARYLADRAGIVWPESKGFSEADQQKEELFKINKLAMIVYNRCLHNLDSGKRAWAYFQKRGLSKETCQKFYLGYAPAAWHTLTEILKKKGVSLMQAESLGLISLGENGYYDRFRDRVIFPITDAKENVIGFGGRTLEETPPKTTKKPDSLKISSADPTSSAHVTPVTRPQPKYLNSPETPIFRKGNFLYGLAWAKDSIRQLNQAIIVEGYLDVIQAHQAGFTQTVASLGTALTKEQARLIKRYASEVILAYDADLAGQQATIRGMEILSEAGLTVKIVVLPAGDDPDSLIRNKGAAEFDFLLKNALNLTDFKLKLAIQEYDLNTPEGKVSAVQAVLPQIALLDNNISREIYLRRMAREVGISETTIFSEFRDWLKKNRKNSLVLDRNNQNSNTKEKKDKSERSGGDLHKIAAKESAPLRQAIFRAEKELLQSALQEYDKFERIKEELIADEFSDETWRALFSELKQISRPLDPKRPVIDELSDSMREIAASLIAEQTIKNSRSDLLGYLNRLKKLRLEERIQKLTSEITVGKDESGQAFSEDDLKQKIQEFTELKNKLQRDYSHISAGI